VTRDVFVTGSLVENNHIEDIVWILKMLIEFVFLFYSINHRFGYSVDTEIILDEIPR